MLMSMSSSIALRHDTIAESYADCRLLIYKVVHTFANRYNVPFDELLSEAHMSFVRAFDRYDPSRFVKKAKFSSFVYFALSCDLRTYLQKQRKHTGHLEINEELCGTEDPNQFRLRFESHLEMDARTVIHLVLDAPDELSEVLGLREVSNKRGFLRALREHLRDLGWSRDRIAIAFEEISVVLLRY